MVVGSSMVLPTLKATMGKAVLVQDAGTRKWCTAGKGSPLISSPFGVAYPPIPADRHLRFNPLPIITWVLLY